VGPTIRLNGTVPAESVLVLWGGARMDSMVALKAKFPRDRVVPLLVKGINRVEVSGSLRTGEIFRGFGEVRLFQSLREKPPATNAIHVLSAPGAVPVVLAVGEAGPQARSFAVYDVQGRLVTRWRTVVGAGGSVTWDGRAADGRRVGSGVYLFRAEGGAHGRSSKVVVAR